MSIVLVGGSTLLTTYTCGHTWKTGIVADGNVEEKERLKKIIERRSQEEECAYCQMQHGTWVAWKGNRDAR